MAEEWEPIPRVSRVIPFGYKLSEDDPDVLLPIPLELDALEQARKHVKRFSYRQVASWIEAVTGRKISHMGLQKRLETDAARRRKASALEGWSTRAKAQEEKVRTYKSKVLGATKPEDS